MMRSNVHQIIKTVQIWRHNYDNCFVVCIFDWPPFPRWLSGWLYASVNTMYSIVHCRSTNLQSAHFRCSTLLYRTNTIVPSSSNCCQYSRLCTCASPDSIHRCSTHLDTDMVLLVHRKNLQTMSNWIRIQTRPRRGRTGRQRC